MKFVNQMNLKSAGAFALMLAACVAAVYAGQGGTEFNDVYQLLEDWSTGTLGKIIALGALIVGIGFGLVRQSVIAAAVGIAMALVLNFGPTVISGILTATADGTAQSAVMTLSNGLF